MTENPTHTGLEMDKGGFSWLIQELRSTRSQVWLHPGARTMSPILSLSLSQSTPSPHPVFFPPPLSSTFLCVSSILTQNLPLGWQDVAGQPQASILSSRAPTRKTNTFHPRARAEGSMLALIGGTWVTCSSLNQSLWPRKWDSLIG